MEIPVPTHHDIERYLQITGRRGSQILSALGKLNPSFNAIMGSEIGREIIKDDLDTVEMLFSKIYEETATPQELAEFRVLRDKILPKRMEKLRYYLEQVGQIKKAGESK